MGQEIQCDGSLRVGERFAGLSVAEKEGAITSMNITRQEREAAIRHFTRRDHGHLPDWEVRFVVKTLRELLAERQRERHAAKAKDSYPLAPMESNDDRTD